MDRRKVISDWIIATQETVYLLQMWLGLLEDWRERGQAEPDDFMVAYHQLKEAEYLTALESLLLQLPPLTVPRQNPPDSPRTGGIREAGR